MGVGIVRAVGYDPFGISIIEPGCTDDSTTSCSGSESEETTKNSCDSDMLYSICGSSEKYDTTRFYWCVSIIIIKRLAVCGYVSC